MKLLKKIWSRLLALVAILLVADALVFLYITLNPQDELARKLQRYEPIFNLVKQSDLRLEPAERPQPAATAKYVISVREGDTLLALDSGHPLFARPNLDSEIVGASKASAEVPVLSEQNGWYKVDLNGKTGWVHPFISASQLRGSRQSSANISTASRASERLASGEFARGGEEPAELSHRQRQLQQLFARFDSEDLALLPTSADPERLLQALELMGPDVRQRHVDDFILYTVNPAWQQRAANLLENLRQAYLDELGPAIIDPSSRSTAFVFMLPSVEAYRDYYPSHLNQISVLTTGHYEGGIMAVHPNWAAGAGRYRTLVHEATHHYNSILLRIGATPDLSWLEEGLATYFGFADQSRDGEIEPDRIAGSSSTISGIARVRIGDSPRIRLDKLKRDLRRGWRLDAGGLIGLTRDQFYQGDVIDNYTRSWLLVHYLLNGEDGRYRDGFFRYIAKARLNPVDSKEFARIIGMDLGQFNRRWQQYVLTL